MGTVLSTETRCSDVSSQVTVQTGATAADKSGTLPLEPLCRSSPLTKPKAMTSPVPASQHHQQHNESRQMSTSKQSVKLKHIFLEYHELAFEMRLPTINAVRNSGVCLGITRPASSSPEIAARYISLSPPSVHQRRYDISAGKVKLP